MQIPPDLLKRADVSDRKREFRYCQGITAQHVVYAYLLANKVPDLSIPDCGEDRPYKVDTDMKANGQRLDVKCSCFQTIPADQRSQDFDAYVFVKTSADRRMWIVLGWLPKGEYWAKCRRAGKGEVYGGRFPANYALGWLPSEDCLRNPASLLSWLGAQPSELD